MDIERTKAPKNIKIMTDTLTETLEHNDEVWATESEFQLPPPLRHHSAINRGQLLMQMILFYGWHGILMYLLNWLEPGTSVIHSPWIVGTYLSTSIFNVMLSRYLLRANIMFAPSLHLSVISYWFFAVGTQKNFLLCTLLWYCSLMYIQLQRGYYQTIRRDLIIFNSCFIASYVSICFLFRYAKSFNIASTISSVNERHQWIGLGTLLVFAFVELYLQVFIQGYAENVLKHADDLAKLESDRQRLATALEQEHEKEKEYLDNDTPATKVIRILRSIQKKFPLTMEIMDALDDTVQVLMSGQLYQPSLDVQKLDKEIGRWLISTMQYEEKPRTQQDGRLSGAKLDGYINISPAPQTPLSDSDFDSWEFNIFKLNHARPLWTVASKLFEKYEFVKTMKLDHQLVENFFLRIEKSYHEVNPYHNAFHAADVMQTTHFFLCNTTMDRLSDDERLACLVAAACHDVEHPGFNNSFLVNTRSPLALQYNDMAVLEQFQAARTFEILLNEPGCNFLRDLPRERYAKIRNIIVSTILATDMSRHFEYISKFKNKMNCGQLDIVNDGKDRQLMMDIMVKCADISNPAKPPVIAKQWTDRIMREFFLQGDEEKRLGLPVSTFMDRNNTSVPKCQLGFIDYVVRPLYEPWSSFVNQPTPTRCPWEQYLKENVEYWKSHQEADEGKPAVKS